MDASYAMKLNQQKLINLTYLIYFYHINYTSVKKKT